MRQLVFSCFSKFAKDAKRKKYLGKNIFVKLSNSWGIYLNWISGVFIYIPSIPKIYMWRCWLTSVCSPVSLERRWMRKNRSPLLFRSRFVSVFINQMSILQRFLHAVRKNVITLLKGHICFGVSIKIFLQVKFEPVTQGLISQTFCRNWFPLLKESASSSLEQQLIPLWGHTYNMLQILTQISERVELQQ